MEIPTHIPFADESGNGTPLSLLHAAIAEPGVGLNARTFIHVAIELLKSGHALTAVCFDKSQIEAAERRVKELIG